MPAMSDYVINLSACELLISTRERKNAVFLCGSSGPVMESIMTFVQFALAQANHHTKLNHQLKLEELLTKPLFGWKETSGGSVSLLLLFLF